jgi:hypothetical protein
VTGGLLIGFGVLVLVAAGFMGWIAVAEWQQQARLEALPALTAGDLEREPLGREGYIEGYLSDTNPEQAHGFVLYYRSLQTREARGDEPASWRSIDSVLPPLVLDTPSGSVRVFGEYSVTFQGSDPTWVGVEARRPGETERFEGLPAGHPVTGVGAIAEDWQGRALEIRALGSGTIDDLRRGARSGGLFATLAAAVLGVVGLVLVGVGVRLF